MIRLSLLFLPFFFSSLNAATIDPAQLKDEVSSACGTQPSPSIQIARLQAYDCGLENIKVYSSDQESAELACEGYARADRFFSELGYGRRALTEILISNEFPEDLKPTGLSWENTFGLVNITRDSRLYMPPYRTKAGGQDALGVHVDREYYTSIAAHETAHILAQYNYRLNCKFLPKEQSEYVAYVTQYATMHSDQLALSLNLLKEKGWEHFGSRDDVNIDYVGVNPQGFGIKSFLFFQRPEGRRHFTDIMNADVLPSKPTDWN